MITADAVQNAMLSSGETFFTLRQCGICGSTIGYSIRGGELYFEPACDCSYSPPEPRNFQSVADLINMQNPEWQEKMKAKFFLKDKP